MKSLKESLFDTEKHIEKDLTFGDVYEPVWITSTNSDGPFKKITNMFNMSELRKASKGKKLDLSSVQQNGRYDNKYLDTIEMIAGLVADFPYKLEPYYDSDIINTFQPLVRSPLFRRGIDVCIRYRGLVRGLGNDIIELHITKSTATEYTDVVIKFDKV